MHDTPLERPIGCSCDDGVRNMRRFVPGPSQPPADRLDSVLTIVPLPVPDTHTDPSWRDLCILIRANERELIGGPQWDVDDEAHLDSEREDTESVHRRWLAYVDDAPAGFRATGTSLVDSPESATVAVYVLPEHRSRGVATALIEAFEADPPPGLTRVKAWVETPITDGATLTPPSGHGAMDPDHPGVRLTLKYGLKLGIIERVSRYDFATPLVDPAEALSDAQQKAGDEYEVLAWEGGSPEDLLPGQAVLKERMAVDQPLGDLTVVETRWDAARLRERERVTLLTNRLFHAVVRHVPSGTVAAVSEMALDRGNPEAFVDQYDTIVLPEHRGRRLGMLVKAANLLQVREAVPTATSIVTWNAVENRYMLGVNEALGFYPILISGGFERSVGGE